MGTTRTRTRSDAIASNVHFTNTWNNQPSTSGDIFNGGYSGKFEEISDVAHPGYAMRRKNGELIMDDFMRTVTQREFVSGSIVRSSGYSDDWTHTRTGDFAADAEKGMPYIGPTLDSNTITGAMDVALIDAYAKIRDNTIMSGEIMSSLGQSLRMLRRPFGNSVKLMKQCYNSAKRSYRKTAKSVTQANADAWLEYRYGWAPIFMDMKTGLNMYSKREYLLLSQRRVVRASTMASCKGTSSYVDATLSTAPYLVSGNVTYHEEVGAHGGVIYLIGDRSTSQALVEDLRLEATSLASTAWEIVPFSFVFDWFVKVGPWLEAVNLPPSVTVLGNWVTAVSKVKKQFNISEIKWWNPYRSRWDYVTSSGSEYNITTISRDVGRTLPSYPPVTLKLPGVIRSTDALALSLSPLLGLMNKLRH